MSAMGGRGTRFGGRGLKARLKTARGRKPSSSRWLKRQLDDPYVAEAKRRGYPSRAAFKLLELDDRFRFLKPGMVVVDLGAAPGGWTHVAVERVKAGRGRVVALDVRKMEPVAGAVVLCLDIGDRKAAETVKAALGGPADAVLSDMAGAATGHAATDHLRIMGLCEAAFAFAAETLGEGGVFVCKTLQGGTQGELLGRLKRAFKSVRHAKPPASRPGSAETYLVAMGYKGQAET